MTILPFTRAKDNPQVSHRTPPATILTYTITPTRLSLIPKTVLALRYHQPTNQAHHTTSHHIPTKKKTKKKCPTTIKPLTTQTLSYLTPPSKAPFVAYSRVRYNVTPKQTHTDTRLSDRGNGSHYPSFPHTITKTLHGHISSQLTVQSQVGKWSQAIVIIL